MGEMANIMDNLQIHAILHVTDTLYSAYNILLLSQEMLI